ncbi:hypothetical protein HYH02_001901 [Chlamydomonas schloesseri]|uniref:N-acetyltransferase domain-containing protein n=1 Tax=Chlamydomonas schloesseri TaxID=2026947 RepID=A0A835WT23_9CHLO|nr:hypothetical protein HYH02_001901 [Chlamydomonas schloesseri]|eukprot:KAG2453689.1 hypothetical protein HYH02_001901 [Chlamydomonas schloesseri]
MATAQAERRLRLAATRSLLYSLPINELFELPGRPHVVYQLRSYANTANPEEAALAARSDSPFLFKAFETGQIGPKRLARIHGGKPRVHTIHEYLDWTVTAQAAEGDDDLDFGGFRVLVILPRYRSGWPPPGGDVTAAEELRKPSVMGAPKSPIPILQSHGKPVTAATIRSGPGYLEIPFVATHENKRGRGYCRCLVEAIEEIARTLGLKRLMLCSTNDASVQSTWKHLGFHYCPDEQMEEWDILHTDMVYLQNTTQMQKDVPAPRRFKPVIIKHEDFKQRSYAFVGFKRALPPARRQPPAKRVSSKAPPKKAPANSEVSERSECSKDDSLSIAARTDHLGPGLLPNGGASSSMVGGRGSHIGASPLGVGAAGTTPLGGRLPGGDEGPLLGGGVAAGGLLHARDDMLMAGGGPPTPQPADGGPLRPLNMHMPGDGPGTSHSTLGRPGMDGPLQMGMLPQPGDQGMGLCGPGGSGRLLWPSNGQLGPEGLGPGPPPLGAGPGPSGIGSSFSWQGPGGLGVGGSGDNLLQSQQQLSLQPLQMQGGGLPGGGMGGSSLGGGMGGGFDGSGGMRQGLSPSLQPNSGNMPLGMQGMQGIGQSPMLQGSPQPGRMQHGSQTGMIQGSPQLQGMIPTGPHPNLLQGSPQPGLLQHGGNQPGIMQGGQHGGMLSLQPGPHGQFQNRMQGGLSPSLHQHQQQPNTMLGGQPLSLQGGSLQGGMHGMQPNGQGMQLSLQGGGGGGGPLSMQGGQQPGGQLTLPGMQHQGMQMGMQQGMGNSLLAGRPAGMQPGGASNLPANMQPGSMSLSRPPVNQPGHMMGMQGGMQSGMQGGSMSTGMPSGMVPTGMMPTGMVPTGMVPTGMVPVMQGGMVPQGGQQGMGHGMQPQGMYNSGMGMQLQGGRPMGMGAGQQPHMQLGQPGVPQQGLVQPPPGMGFMPAPGSGYGGQGMLRDGG